jgi:hypothetical protein
MPGDVRNAASPTVPVCPPGLRSPLKPRERERGDGERQCELLHRILLRIM